MSVSVAPLLRGPGRVHACPVPVCWPARRRRGAAVGLLSAKRSWAGPTPGLEGVGRVGTSTWSLQCQHTCGPAQRARCCGEGLAVPVPAHCRPGHACGCARPVPSRCWALHWASGGSGPGGGARQTNVAATRLPKAPRGTHRPAPGSGQTGPLQAPLAWVGWGQAPAVCHFSGFCQRERARRPLLGARVSGASKPKSRGRGGAPPSAERCGRCTPAWCLCKCHCRRDLGRGGGWLCLHWRPGAAPAHGCLPV